MSSKVIVLVLLIIALALFLVAIFFIRKGISFGFKPVEEDKKKLCNVLRNMVIVFYSVSVVFMLAMKVSEFLIRSVDFTVKTFDFLTNICISGAVITGVISFISLVRWCRLRCRKSWPWLWGFIVGAFSVFANFYLIFEVVRNSRDRNLKKV